MSKWYVVGKVCGIVASVKVLGLLAIGFCAGVLAMDEGEARKKRKHTQECDTYNQGWNDCHHCIRRTVSRPYPSYANFDGEETGEYEFGASEDAGTKED